MSIDERQECAQLLAEVLQLEASGDRLAAIRLADRAWRKFTSRSAEIAPIYGRLLLEHGEDLQAALVLLQRAAELHPCADNEGLLISALVKTGRVWPGLERLEAALRRYRVSAGDRLAQAAHAVICSPEAAAWGWIGLDGPQKLVGELVPTPDSSLVDVDVAGKPLSNRQDIAPAGGATRAFTIELDSRVRAIGALEARVGRQALLGSGLQLPPAYGLEGQIRCEGNTLSGWASLQWDRSLPLKLCVEDETGTKAWIYTQATPGSEDALKGHPYSLDLVKAGIKGKRISVSATLPSGQMEPLPDSPWLQPAALQAMSSRLPSAARGTPGSPSMQRRQTAPRGIDIVIPVYTGYEATLSCIHSVLATADRAASVIVIDDASPDAALSAALDRLAAEGRIQLLRNASNQGFVGSVNRGMALHDTTDVVLLNSDTQVFGNWLQRLQAAAYRDADTGTITPLTNDGTIVSYGEPGSMSPSQVAAQDPIAARVNAGMRVELPVGVGFCLYIRRDCLNEVGLFDSATFGKGYGEECDFCLRARAHGWKHYLAADVFVYHAGGHSFGARREALLARSQHILDVRYPEYHAEVAQFIREDRVLPARRALDESRLRAEAQSHGKRHVLIVTLALSGGVDRFVAERCAAIRERGMVPLVLRPRMEALSTPTEMRKHCNLWTDSPAVDWLTYSVPAELDALQSLLAQLPLDHIELQHFLGIDERLVDRMLGLGVPHDVYIHDYVWICPRITLIDESRRYCGEPALAACEACVQRNGSNLEEDISVAQLRTRSARWLSGARSVYAPSADAAVRISHHFPTLRIQVRGAEALPLISSTFTPTPAPPVRVALIGAIGVHKGYRQLLACARDAAERSLPLEFVVIGFTEDDRTLMDTGKVFVTGRYTDGEVPHLIKREAPHLAWFSSVWPETWCYTLTHALAAGLPVAAFDIGAVAERLRALNHGVMLPLNMEAAALNDRFIEIARNPGKPVVAGTIPAAATPPMADKPSQSPRLAPRLAVPPDGSLNAPPARTQEPTAVSQMDKTPAPSDAAQDGLSASVQLLPLPAGLYLFSVGAAAPNQIRHAGNLALPAVNITLGPGVSASQVEFVSGPSTAGAWLFSPGDLLVARISGQGATLIMTSIRAPGGQALSIRVEKLENRKDEAPAVAAAAPVAAVVAAPAPAAVPAETHAPGTLKLRIGAHVRMRGDLTFETPWAGRVGPGLWIESFSITPLETFAASDIEYKGLAANGFETPWLSDGAMCGTRHMGIPLVGFAVRLRPGPLAASYHCEYSAYFKSGLTVGPMKNGAPCRSASPGDALEGLQVRIYPREDAGAAAAPAPSARAPIGPSFSKLREDAAGDDAEISPRAPRKPA